MPPIPHFSPAHLQELAEKLGGGSELARRANINPSLVSRYLKGTNHPTISNLAAIAQGCSVSLDWLVFGRSSLNAGLDETLQRTIPFYSQGASAGPGAFTEDALPSAMIALPSPLLGRSSRTLFALPAEGDSMEPLIRDGSLLVAERTQTPHEGIYVLARNELLFVKRIQPREPGVLRVISENQAYGTEDIRLDDPHQNLRILGRVIWIGHSI
jgi:phage repressor protein C with HTH and peptisase S24 domain